MQDIFLHFCDLYSNMYIRILKKIKFKLERGKMKEQIYEIENQESFELKHIFDCGQCFRWNEESDGSYTGVFKSNVLNVQKAKNKIIFKGIVDGDIKEVVEDYFDLKRDYTKIKQQLSKIDNNVKQSVKYGEGIRILNQELFETILSFIISANNNIPRIKGIIERISQKYGNEIKWQGKSYYSFPSLEQLKNVSVEDYRSLGTGFRDKRLYETVHMLLDKKVDIAKWYEEVDTMKVRDELLTLSGVGPKVADCILLFSDLKRFDVFPIDVWVRRVMNELYINNPDETKVNKKQIEQIAKDKFGALEGLAQQYLFYWKRDA